MKKGFYLLILLTMFMPFCVYGASADFSLDCSSTVKKGGTVSCTIKSDVTPDADEVLKEFSAVVKVDEEKVFVSGTTINETDLDLTGTGKVVKSFDLALKTNALIGNADIEVSQIEAKDNLNNSIMVSNTTLKSTVKVLNNDTTLKTLMINGKQASCNLADNSCTIDSVKKETINVSATTNDSNATISGVGNKKLVCGNNKITLTITAEDKSTKGTYTINANRVCQTDTALKNIQISSGSLNPTFAENTKTYTVNVTKDVDKITISATKKDDTQTVSGEVKDKALNYGENKFTINVTSESGAKTAYTITVNREDGRDTNNYLSNLEISSGKLTFDKETAEYKVKVLHEVEKINVVATAESSLAKVEITNNNLTLKDGENTPIIIKVTSEQGTEKIYKIIVERLKEGETLGDNPNLLNLIVEGYDLGFSYDKSDYTLKIKDEDSLVIKATVEEDGTEVRVKGNNNLKNGDVITITTISLDGTTRDYRIVIEKSNNLIFIIIASVVGVAALVGIVVLLIKNKKDKDKITTDNLKNQLREEEILKQANLVHEEKKEEDPFGPTKPLSINPNYENSYSSQNINNIQQEKPTISNVSNNVGGINPDLNNRFNFNTYKEEQEERPVVLEDKDATKVCSICGHRVSASLKTCPYCKRSF